MQTSTRQAAPDKGRGMQEERASSLAGLGTETRWLTAAVILSLTAHMLFFAAVLYAHVQPARRPSSAALINVQLVTLPASAQTAPVRQPAQTAPKVSQKKATRSIAPVKTETAPKPADTATPAPVREKFSLKKKTYQREKVKQSALESIEKQVETSAAEQIASAIDRLKREVAATGSAIPADETGQSDAPAAGVGDEGGRIAELIDIYRIEIAYQIERNWAFADQLAAGRDQLLTAVVFKVMPDGEIRDLIFTDRSGNANLDESVFRAVMKSNPVAPHPESIRRPYVEMGLRFTPEGVQ